MHLDAVITKKLTTLQVKEVGPKYVSLYFYSRNYHMVVKFKSMTKPMV